MITILSYIYKGYFQKGNQGVLCAECEENFGITDGYTCAFCDSHQVYLRQLFILIIRVLLFCIELNKAFQYGKILKNSKGELDEWMKHNAFSSYLINITKDHF
jgi:hypothetical protein